MYFKTEEEKNQYFPNGVPSNILAIVQADADSPAVLYTTSNNSSMSGTMKSQGGYATDPEDKARISYIEAYYATQDYVDDAITYAALGSEVDLSDYALKNEIPSLEGYATEAYVMSQGFLTSHQDLGDYATQAWVDNQGFLTNHQSLEGYAQVSDIPSLEGYATESYVMNQGFLTSHQSLSDYATKAEISAAGYLTSHQSLSGLATESYVTSKIEEVVGAAPAALDTLKEIGDSLNNDSDFAGTMTTALASKANASDVYTKSEIDNAGYLTSHQSLAGYATEQYVDNAVANATPSIDLSSYVTKTELSNASYLTSNMTGKGILCGSNSVGNINVAQTRLWFDNYGISVQYLKGLNDWTNLFMFNKSLSTIVASSSYITLGVSQYPWSTSYVTNTYTTNLFLGSNNTNITTMFPSYSYVNTKIGNIETVLNSILGNS